MPANEKISKALKSATAHVNNSIQAVEEEEENLIDKGVWHASADLEYALFIFSIVTDDQVDKSGWNPNPRFKKGEINPPLIKVRDLIDKAETSLKDEKLLNAYKNASVARSYLLKLQKYFTKKKRKALKNKKKKHRIDFASL